MTKAEKEAFKKRMAAGRKKAKNARGKQNPKKRKPAKTTKPAKNKKAKVKSRPTAKANPKRKPAKKKNGGARRRNSLEGAEKQFESFHGKKPGKVLEYDLQYRYPEHFAELGRLVELRFFLDEANPDFALTSFGKTQVVCTPDGANIYFIGGDQAVDLAALGITSDKDFVELGACSYISYHTTKGFHDFEPTTYWHPFGEEDDILPGLVYDRLNKSLFLTSGNYRVRPEGIVN